MRETDTSLEEFLNIENQSYEPELASSECENDSAMELGQN